MTHITIERAKLEIALVELQECKSVDDNNRGRHQAITAIKQALAAPTVQEPVAKLQVTLQDRPIDIELAQYKRMFESACSALGAIGDALGCDPEEGGAEPILDAIAELKATRPAPPVQEPVAWMYPDDYERMLTSETFCTVYSVEVGSATRGKSTVPLYTTPPAQPAVPDAMTSADIQEHIEYVAGWNECRQAMLEMMK